MRPLVLSGGPAAGKTTCAQRLARERDRAAFVDADDVRQLVVSGHEPLWSGLEGQGQHVLAARNVAALGRNLVSAGFDLTVSDVVTASALTVYRSELPGCFVVQFQLTLDEARRRAATRQVYLTEEEFELLHDVMASPPDVDLLLNVTTLSVREQVAAIREAW